jgi:hypothetical protein
LNLLENHFQALFGSLLRHLLTLFGSTLVFALISFLYPIMNAQNQAFAAIKGTVFNGQTRKPYPKQK